MEKGAHKLLLYFVAIFILPTLVRKLRDETTRREEIAQRACMCVWAAWLAAWLAAWICIYVANTVTQQSPHLPPACPAMLHPVAALTVGKRGVYAIFTRDTQQMAALYAMAPYFSAKQGKTKERTKQNRERQTKKEEEKQKQNRELTKLCILALKVSARSVCEFKFILCVAVAFAWQTSPMEREEEAATEKEREREGGGGERIKPVHK